MLILLASSPRIALDHVYAASPKALFLAGALALLGALMSWEIATRARRHVVGDCPGEGAPHRSQPNALARLLGERARPAGRDAPSEAESLNLSTLLLRASRRHGRTDVQGAVAPVYVRGNTAMLVGLVDILLANALASGSRAVARLDHGTTMAVVHIDDDGPGVPRADRAFVFEPGASRSLRLPVSAAGREACVAARQAARAHGGDITISSSPEGGARFTVRLPLDTARMEQERLATAALPPEKKCRCPAAAEPISVWPCRG